MSSTSKKRAGKKCEKQRPDESQSLPIVRWPARRSHVVLAVLTLICLAPFSGKPFHMDDPLFVWAAQQIVHHPLDPYGFNVVWYTTSAPASEIVKNPPLAAYYLAGVGRVAGWSERTLHIAFLLPALVAILGTYNLASRLTTNPLLAAIATLLTPGFLVSSTNVMCDTLMLAAWILAIIFWLEGLNRASPLFLTSSALLISFCALTKYFGMALIPLLLVYSIARKRRLGSWALYLLIPVAFLAAYQYWTHIQYGRGLLADAAAYALGHEAQPGDSILAKTIVGLGFVGGCALTGLTCAPLLWSRKMILSGLVLAALAGVACASDWISVANSADLHRNWVWVQLGIFVFGGISIIALPVADWWNQKTDPESLLLGLWVAGTFFFAAFTNWTVNARSILAMIPAVGILLARRFGSDTVALRRRRIVKVGIALGLAGVVSLWVTWADVRLAESERSAAKHFQQAMRSDIERLNFQGHWGFQYYMQLFGFRPFDSDTFDYERGDIVVIPENNADLMIVPREYIASSRIVQFETKTGAATVESQMGAGFYCYCWGPLPYAFGPVPSERYAVVQTIRREP
jgi:Dolichyl-phosphate-mannose-protein mannosyltransferase